MSAYSTASFQIGDACARSSVEGLHPDDRAEGLVELVRGERIAQHVVLERIPIAAMIIPWSRAR
jgi:hypothetical protein